MIKKLSLTLLMGVLACTPVELPNVDPSQRLTTALVRLGPNDPPPQSSAGTCWGRDTTPAKIETVTEQIELRPARVDREGVITRPAVYRTETSQRIIKDREEVWFRTPCATDLTPDFIATLQRALKARRFYRGAISGVLDIRTQASIRRYQTMRGLDSALLSLATAQQLGIVAYDIETSARER